MRIAGFAKFRNEIIRCSNVYRALASLEATCDTGILCDDASTDGTADILQAWGAAHGWTVLHIPPHEQSFERELEVKQRMLEIVGAIEPEWIWWLDADETLDAEGTAAFRYWVAAQPLSGVPGYRFHYTQLWRNTSWARTDDGFDDGEFVKLWRYRPGLSFDVRPGTHRSQFPTQIPYGQTGRAPFEIIHWGNYGKNLQWKAHQYAGGLGGVDRHLAFGHTPAESLATGEGYDQAHWSRPHPTYRPVEPNKLPPMTERDGGTEPWPFMGDEIRRIRSMGNMRGLPGWFTVVIPTYNRAGTLPRALESLLTQRYEKWIALVLDDGSTDETQQIMRAWQKRDPRIFYCRYKDNRGGVAMNEYGMAMACEFTEWWTRLGSDDWWGANKLSADAEALQRHEAVYGPFRVWRNGAPAEVCAGEWGPAHGETPSGRLKAGRFLGSWANVATRTSVLRRVREKWGGFCDSRLRNMEDFLVNYRIARLTEWHWRLCCPEDAWWNCLEAVGADASASASANADVTTGDQTLTLQLIAEDSAAWVKQMGKVG